LNLGTILGGYQVGYFITKTFLHNKRELLKKLIREPRLPVMGIKKERKKGTTDQHQSKLQTHFHALLKVVTDPGYSVQAHSSAGGGTALTKLLDTSIVSLEKRRSSSSSSSGICRNRRKAQNREC